MADGEREKDAFRNRLTVEARHRIVEFVAPTVNALDAFVHARAKKFEQTYPWTYFRRSNREYNYRGVPYVSADRYFDRMRSYHWQIATELGRNTNAAALEDDDDLRPTVMAQAEVFDMLATDRVPLLAFHFPWPGYGNLAKQGEGFRYYPTPMTIVPIPTKSA